MSMLLHHYYLYCAFCIVGQPIVSSFSLGYEPGKGEKCWQGYMLSLQRERTLGEKMSKEATG
ncbi:hypothetical protein B9Z19DRAFT_1072326 [Tuber borchii]|uniref:Uncharacterized protein n=1 Tax=Tuber borchii TaxID=42251 RepID=A0A2T7A6U4_TUBBO|nr:hypothetical protein B9Z19DRAFT_1072326 [Tuber borchii]